MRIAVLMGGVSSEREISLLSGEGVAAALEGRGHDVARVDVREESLEGLRALAPDVAFIALHGRFGEDGGAQRRLESLGVPYTGSGPAASALAMDKDASKRAFIAADVPTPAWRLVEPPFRPEALAILLRAYAPGLPCVVKPLAEGSSIGVSIVREERELAPALTLVEGLASPALVEAFVEGREFTVGVLGERALPPIELVPRRAFYDYQAKYAAGSGTEYRIDPPLPFALRDALLETGLAAHRALGCEGASRVDIRVDPSGRPWVLEVNTIPGMTPRSLLPKAAEAAGIGYGELCERIVALGVSRARARLGEAA
jgi:D-alanine-D-alanine ligase